MIDDRILDALFPVPELETLQAETVQALREEGFAVTKFRAGGVFNMLLMVALQIKILLTQLQRRSFSNMFLSHAEGGWLDLKAADYSKVRKAAQKAQGVLTLHRSAEFREAIRFTKGQVFKTKLDINGEELRFFLLEDATLQAGLASLEVAIEAEREGARYNVPEGQICRSLLYVEGLASIANGANWLRQEGSDTESDEALRTRCLRAWAELAQRPIADAYKNAAEGVPAVLFAQVNDQLPRGQGTLDVIATSTAGEASAALLAKVRTAIEPIIGPCDDVLVKSAVTVRQDIALTLTLSEGCSSEDAISRARAVLTDLLSLKKSRVLHALTHAELIHAVMQALPQVRNVKVTSPATDVLLSTDRVILAGQLHLTAEGGLA